MSTIPYVFIPEANIVSTYVQCVHQDDQQNNIIKNLEAMNAASTIVLKNFIRISTSKLYASIFSEVKASWSELHTHSLN